MKMKKILILSILLLLIFSSSGYAYDLGNNEKQIVITTKEGNKLKLEFLLITLDILRLRRVDFTGNNIKNFNATTHRKNILFTVNIKNLSSQKANFQAKDIKLIANKKSIFPKLSDRSAYSLWETPIKRFEDGILIFPTEKISNFKFKKLKLALKTKNGIEYIEFNRDKLKYDFKEKFRKNAPKNNKFDFYIKEGPYLGFRNSDEFITKRTFSRNKVSNITLKFTLGYLANSRNKKRHTIRCQWYNKNGFYKENIIKDTNYKKFNFLLNKNEIRKNVGVWSVLIYIDNHFLSHQTFLIR